MDLVLFPKLSTCSKRAILRVRKRWGHPYVYNPRRSLVDRLAEEFQLPREVIIQQLHDERAFLLRHYQYFR